MTTLHERTSAKTTPTLRLDTNAERRAFRRHDMETRGITVQRFDGFRMPVLGQLVDLSPGGIRLRTSDGSLRPDQQVRVRLELPVFGGISPFIDVKSSEPRPAREWTGWLTVCRVDRKGENVYEVAGRLVDMEDIDRGMLGLYLSTQPLAA